MKKKTSKSELQPNDTKVVTKKASSNEVEFRQIYDKIPIGVGICSMNNIILEMNPMIMHLFGLSKEDINHYCILDFYVNLEDLKRVRQELSKNGQVVNYEVLLKKKDGIKFWVLLNVTNIIHNGNPAYLASIIDISKRKQMEFNLIQSQDRLHKILEFFPIPILIVKGRETVFINQRFTELYGYTLSEIPNTGTLLELVTLDSKLLNNGFQLFLNDVELSKTILPPPRQFPIKTKSGEIKQLNFRLGRINDEEIFLIAEDITENHAILQKYNKLLESYNESTDKPVQYANIISMIASMFIYDVSKIQENINNAFQTLGSALNVQEIILFKHSNGASTISNSWCSENFSLNEAEINDLFYKLYLDYYYEKLPITIYHNFNINSPSPIINSEFIVKAKKNQIGSALFVPVFLGTERFGTIFINNSNSNRQFSPTEIQLALNIAILIGFAVKNSRNTEQMVDFFETLGNLDLIMVIAQPQADGSFKLVFANSQLYKILGRSEKELSDHGNVLDFLSDEDQQNITKIFKLRSNGMKLPNTYLVTVKTKSDDRKMQLALAQGFFNQKEAIFSILFDAPGPNIKTTDQILKEIPKK